MRDSLQDGPEEGAAAEAPSAARAQGTSGCRMACREVLIAPKSSRMRGRLAEHSPHSTAVASKAHASRYCPALQNWGQCIARKPACIVPAACNPAADGMAGPSSPQAPRRYRTDVPAFLRTVGERRRGGAACRARRKPRGWAPPQPPLRHRCRLCACRCRAAAGRRVPGQDHAPPPAGSAAGSAGSRCKAAAAGGSSAARSDGSRAEHHSSRPGAGLDCTEQHAGQPGQRGARCN